VAVEVLKAGHALQRLQVAHPGVPAGEVLKDGESPQRLQVAHLGAAAVEFLKAGEAPELWWKFADLEPR
jgi:hypothetical protein